MAAVDQLNQATSALVRGAAGLAIHLSAAQLAAFQSYIEAILLWRTRISLTGALSPSVIVEEHILDSLSIAPMIHTAERVADLGSGAGFPGIPVAIVRPQAAIGLVESRRKRASFLREAVRICKLDNVQVVENRAELLRARTDIEFDLIVSRAVWKVPEFLDIAGPLLRIGGRAVAMKSPQGLAEVGSHAAFHSPEIFCYRLHDRIERRLLVFTKRTSA